MSLIFLNISNISTNIPLQSEISINWNNHQIVYKHIFNDAGNVSYFALQISGHN